MLFGWTNAIAAYSMLSGHRLNVSQQFTEFEVEAPVVLYKTCSTLQMSAHDCFATEIEWHLPVHAIIRPTTIE